MLIVYIYLFCRWFHVIFKQPQQSTEYIFLLDHHGINIIDVKYNFTNNDKSIKCFWRKITIKGNYFLPVCASINHYNLILYFRSAIIMLKTILHPNYHLGMKMAFRRLLFHQKSNYMKVGFELQFYVCLFMSVIAWKIIKHNNPIS